MNRIASCLFCLALAGCHAMTPGQSLSVSSLWTIEVGGEDPLLPLASEALDRGDDAAASRFLRLYADRHPESRRSRVLLAEVLFKLGRTLESVEEFERAIAQLQNDRTPDLKMLVHCHGRLVDIADFHEDEFGRHLHRGLGLYWIAQQKRGPDDGAMPTESILFKAADELAAAHAEQPEEARPAWYLHLTWRQLGQSGPAQRWRNTFDAASPFSYLTQRERADSAMPDPRQ